MQLNIYNPEGKLITSSRDFNYSGSAMGEKTVSATIPSARMLKLPPNSYLDFRGERYLMRDEPSIRRTAGTGVRGDALISTFVFKSKQYELVDCDFMDYVLNNDMYYTGMDSFSFYGDAYDLCRRIQANLDGQYTGAEKWTILMPRKGYNAPQPVAGIGWAERTLDSETLQVTLSNENCWNALTRANSDFGFYFYLDTANKYIYVGVEYPEFKVGGELVTFEYGKDHGLYEIQRDIEANTIITKLRAKGSDRNTDRDYLRTENYPRFTQNLQLPIFRATRTLPRPVDYITADPALTAYFGVRPGSKTFDDIYPSIAGMMDENGHAIDEIYAVEALDDRINPDGSLVQSYFYVYLYDLGFDINEFLTSEDATMSMKTGYCAGIDFKIVEATALKPTEQYYSDGCRWKFRLEKDVTSSNNYVIPSGNVKPKKEDKFVLLNILMPESYVIQAEQRLLEAARKYLDENSKSKISYTVNMDENFLADRPILTRALREAISMRIDDNDLGDMEDNDGSRYTVKSVQNLVITYKPNQFVPSYQVTLAEKVIAGPLDRIESEIGNIVENVQNNGSQNTVNRRNGIRNSRNLRALSEKIFDTDGYFDPENIKPNSIETQYLAVGAKSRDFTTNKVSMKAYKEDNTFKVSLSTGYINHRALWWGGGETPPEDINKFTWGINNALVQELTEDAKDYYIYVKAERVSQLAEWFVSTDKMQYDSDVNYYYFLLGVIYPVQEDRRDISLVNGMAYITGGAIYGDVLKSINYVEDESNEGSKYDLNNGSIRIGNKLKGLIFDVVNKVFQLFGVTLEFRNASDEVVSKIDGDTGEAMFGKGAHVFNTDGSLNFANGNFLYDLTSGLSITGKFESNVDGVRLILDPVARALLMKDVNDKDIVTLSIDSSSAFGSRSRLLLRNTNEGNESSLFVYPEGITAYSPSSQKNAGIYSHTGAWSEPYLFIGSEGDDSPIKENVSNSRFAAYLGNANELILLANNLPTSPFGLAKGQLWNDNGLLRIIQ